MLTHLTRSAARSCVRLGAPRAAASRLLLAKATLSPTSALAARAMHHAGANHAAPAKHHDAPVQSAAPTAANKVQGMMTLEQLKAKVKCQLLPLTIVEGWM